MPYNVIEVNASAQKIYEALGISHDRAIQLNQYIIDYLKDNEHDIVKIVEHVQGYFRSDNEFCYLCTIIGSSVNNYIINVQPGTSLASQFGIDEERAEEMIQAHTQALEAAQLTGDRIKFLSQYARSIEELAMFSYTLGVSEAMTNIDKLPLFIKAMTDKANEVAKATQPAYKPGNVINMPVGNAIVNETGAEIIKEEPPTPNAI